MPKPGPLIKTVTIEEGGMELPYLGGGMRVSKSNFGPRRNQNHFRITNNASNSGKLPNLKVGFSANFDDTFGLIVANVHTTIHSHETEITLEFDVTDILVTSEETFVKDLKSYSIILKLDSDEDPIINIDGDDTKLDINNPTHQQFIIRNGTETTIETVGTVADRSFDFASFDRSVGGTSTTNPEVTFTDDTQYETNQVNKNIDKRFGRKQRVKVTPPSSVTFFESGLPKTTQLYGPEEFATIVLIDDENNKGADKSETRIKIKNNTRVEGVELKSVAKTDVAGQPSGVINDSSNLTFTIELSNNKVIHKDDITRICLLRENEFDESYVVANIDTSILDSAGVTTDGNVETHTITFQPNVDGGYQGPVFGFVQMKDVTWSPKSIFDPGLVYDITNKHSDGGAYDVEYVSRTPFMITMKLTQFDHATNIPHTVRINAKIGDEVKSNVEFSGITPTNYEYTANLEHLMPTTEYVITLTVDDGINTTYEQHFGTFETSTDDNQGPDIRFIHLTGHGDHVYLHANIVDNKSPIDEIQTMLMTQSGYTAYFANKPDSEQLTTLQKYGSSYTIPQESTESLFVEIREELGNVITNDQGGLGSFEVGEEYTVIVRAVDASASENANIAVQTVTLYEPIRFGHVGFVDRSGKFDVTVPIEFASAAVSNVDVYCGVFASDPGFTTTNVDLGLPGWESESNVSGPSLPSFTFDAETHTGNPIIDLKQYYVVVYAKSIIDDLAYAPYANIHTTTYTKLDKAGPVFRDVNVNFDNFA